MGVFGVDSCVGVGVYQSSPQVLWACFPLSCPEKLAEITNRPGLTTVEHKSYVARRTSVVQLPLLFYVNAVTEHLLPLSGGVL